MSLFNIIGALCVGLVCGVSAGIQLLGAETKGKALTLGSIGMVIGAVSALSLGEHPDAAVTGFLGAFVGIVGAVGGGLWLWQYQEREMERRTLTAIQTNCNQTAYKLTFLHSQLRSRSSAIDEALSEAETAVTAFEYRVRRYETHLIRLVPDQQNDHALLERYFVRLRKNIGRLRSKWPNISSPSTYKNHAEAIDVDVEIVSNNIRLIEAPITRLSPSLSEHWREEIIRIGSIFIDTEIT